MASQKDLQGRTVAELRAMARDAGVRGFSRMTKAELVAALAGQVKQPPGTQAVEDAEGDKTRAQKTPEARRPRRVTASKRTRATAAERTGAPTAPEPVPQTAPVPVAPTRPDEGLGSLPDGYGEDRITVIPRDPEWTFIHWEMAEATWQAARDRAGGGQATLRVILEDAGGSEETSDAPVNPRLGRYYARVPRPGATVCAEIGVLDARGAFHPVLRSARVQTPWVGPRQGPVRFMTVPPDVPLRDLKKGAEAGVVGRLMTEEEYSRLFGRGHPGSIRASDRAQTSRDARAGEA